MSETKIDLSAPIDLLEIIIDEIETKELNESLIDAKSLMKMLKHHHEPKLTDVEEAQARG